MAVKQILGKVTVTPKGEYSSGETYKRLDIVTSNGQSYIAKVDNTGVNVTNTNTWLQLVEKPEKGIDYFTEEDIAQLVSMVTDDSESEFNEYYNGKVSDFNSNASSKTSEFNSNYDEKVESFNTIFDTSTDNFDSNYETKLSAFNENASTQTSTFNSVVEQATSDFNGNASTLTETFNTNASEKTSAFNINASEKTQEFNDNVDEKTEQITSQLDNYVQFDDYATSTKAGVVKSYINGFQVSNDGNPNAAILSKEQYDTIENQYFISKGTLENIKDDYVESSTPVKNLNTSLKDITPKNNTEGTDNVFDDGLESPLYALGGDGKSEQETTTGKNNLNNTLISQILNGLNIQINEDKSVKIQGTANKDTHIILNHKPEINTGTYTLYGCKAFIESEENNGWWDAENEPVTKTFTTKPILSSQGFFIYVENGQAINKTYYPMLLKGTYTNENIGDYEPYTGGQPSPSSDYPQEINSIEGSVKFDCRGKNLFNKNTVVDGYLSQTGQIESNSGFKTSDFIKVMPNTSYFLNNTNTKRLKFYDINKNAITSDWDLTSAGSQSFTTLSNAYYLRFSIDISVIDINTVQLELGTKETSCEPYIEPNQVTFNLGQEKLRSVGDVKDELVVNLETGDYFKVENIGEVVFDGSDDETIIKRSDTTTPNTSCFRVENFDYTLIRDLIGMCNYFRYDTEKRNIKDTFRFIKTPGYAIQFCIEDNFASNSDEFRTWLSTHNTIVDYILQKPTTKKLGTLSAEDLAKLKTFKGYNNVTVNTNLGLMNIRFTYGLDIKKYVDNKLAEISAQLIKGE